MNEQPEQQTKLSRQEMVKNGKKWWERERGKGKQLVLLVLCM
jgi:hypothetical protein